MAVLVLCLVCAGLTVWDVAPASAQSTEKTGRQEGTFEVGKQPASLGERRLTPEEMETFAAVYLEKYIKCWEDTKPDCFMGLYSSDALIYRTFVRGGKELRRTPYRGNRAIIAGKLSKPNLQQGKISIDASELEGFSEPGIIYIIFRQHFRSMNLAGKVLYEDDVIKMLQLRRQPDGNWQVDFEDTLAFIPGKYAERRKAATSKFFTDLEKTEAIEKLERLEVGLLPTPTPLPTPPVIITTPTPTPPSRVAFKVVHEVSYEPLANVRTDLIAPTGETVGILYSDREGMVYLPMGHLGPGGVIDLYVSFHKPGFQGREVFRHTYNLDNAYEIVLLPLVKPLEIAQRHRVRRGQALPELSTYYYGTDSFWPILLAQNNHQALRHDALLPETVLSMPAVNAGQVAQLFFGTRLEHLDAESGHAVTTVRPEEAETRVDTSLLKAGEKLYKITFGPVR
jgi:hypothetical protein